MAVNIPWEDLKAEYLASGISQKALAEEHGIPWSTLRDKAQREKWAAEREKVREKIGKDLAKNVSDQKIKKLNEIIDRLITQTMTATRQNTKRPVQIRETEVLGEGCYKVTVRTEYEDVNVVDKAGLRLLSQTVKDLDEILRRQRQESAGHEDKTITVRFESADGNDYSV